MLEATRKKVDFLQHVIRLLGITNCRAFHGRAEEIAHKPKHRESYDAVTARALASLPALVELCLPFAKLDGVLIAPKGAGVEEEISEASNALSVLGGEAQGIVLPDSEAPIPTDHRLVIIHKVTPAPDSYPRRSGVPTRRPL